MSSSCAVFLAGLVFAARLAPALPADAPDDLDGQTELKWDQGVGSADRLQRALPLCWMHSPKTSSSIGNTILRAACPQGTFPEGEPVITQSVLGAVKKWGVKAKCAAEFSSAYTSPPGHVGLGDAWAECKGKAVGMFRQPEQRLISGWNFGAHSANYAKTVEEYRDAVRGCQVKMVMRAGGDAYQPMSGPCGDPRPVTDEEVWEAVRRVRDDFAWVGLTERHAMSVCLWHAAFGGDCGADEFVNTRQGKGRERKEGAKRDYDVAAVLGAWRDEADGALHQAAKARFEEELRAYGLDEEVCRTKICPRGAAHFK